MGVRHGALPVVWDQARRQFLVMFARVEVRVLFRARPRKRSGCRGAFSAFARWRPWSEFCELEDQVVNAVKLSRSLLHVLSLARVRADLT
jgi:hypothetical protein